MLAIIGAIASRAEEVPVADPPDGVPSNPSVFTYAGDRIGLQWVNGDETAYTQAGLSASSGTEPASVAQTAQPGETSMETDFTDTEHWWLRHFKSGVGGTWIRAPFGE